MIRIFFLGLLLLSLISFGQERLTPLRSNTAIFQPAAQTRASELNSLDSTFVFEFTSLDLEYVHDDFSTNKFEMYTPDFDEDGVTSEWFYRLMDPTNTTPQDPSLVFCDSAYSKHDTVKIEDGLLIDVVSHHPFTAEDIWVNDLDFYPVAGGIKSVFQECYVLVDTIIDGVLDDDQDTLWYNLPGDPNYVQDSAHVFTKVVTDTNSLWVDNYAYRNFTFAENPWSLGVATFDGVDENGRPYEFGNEDAYGIADYLTTRPIDLSVADPGDDFVYLTFLYQAEGFGNMPDEFDSLLVDIWHSDEEVWTTLPWAGTHEVGPDQWDTARLAIPSSHFLDGFRFRFKNYASLSGALDHWHIDFVSLRIDVLPETPNFSDIAIAYPVNTFLKDYTAVPWDHYINTSGNEKMISDYQLQVYNSDLTPTSFAPGTFIIEKDGILQGASPYAIPSKGDPDNPDYLLKTDTVIFNVGGGYFFDQAAGGDQARFDVKVNISTATEGSNRFLSNDTSRFTQHFANYYAYDDGSAEMAYGIEGEGALMAYKFEAYEPGELTGILMHFVQSVTDFSDEIFFLTVWDDDGGEPGEVIYRDNFFTAHSPKYAWTQNGFSYYTFTNDEYLVDGYLPVGEVFYVGWENVEYNRLNIGADMNIDNGDKIFRNTSGAWLTSAYELSLLIRPVFSTALDYTLSNERQVYSAVDEQVINLYPNPTQNNFQIDGLPQEFVLNLYDLSGRVVLQQRHEKSMDISHLEKGVYIVDVRAMDGSAIFATKLIKE
ncbi:T9SS type A sorting domain-containing protein [Crocinitomix algicola]|uniref:T9SS type A sorting domain-containing protein n=1 Tax=Crocinitomix algicola TaxID=1740263 RepID=UPI000872D1EB|nr:T9SS type A sorting domain-containing protein [Crocinitomix algicola]